MLVHPDDREHISVQWADCRQLSAERGNQPVYGTFTYRALRMDGTYLWVEASACVTSTHWYNIVRDISDQRRLEMSLKGVLHCMHGFSTRALCAEHAQCDAGFLTSTMADMRQPLTAIQAASELLAQRVSVREDEEASFLVAAISSASHMLMGARRRSRVLPIALSACSSKRGVCGRRNCGQRAVAPLAGGGAVRHHARALRRAPDGGQCVVRLPHESGARRAHTHRVD